VPAGAVAREATLQRDVMTAQLQAQASAVAQEREALAQQRLNTDMLTSLSEQVGGWGYLSLLRGRRPAALTCWPPLS